MSLVCDYHVITIYVLCRYSVSMVLVLGYDMCVCYMRLLRDCVVITLLCVIILLLLWYYYVIVMLLLCGDCVIIVRLALA